MGERITKVDEFILWCKNHKWISIVLIISLAIIALGQLTDAVEKIEDFLKSSSAPSSSVKSESPAYIAKLIHTGYNFPGKYQGASFSLIGDGECLENSVITENHVDFKFTITNPTILMDLSPLEVRIVRPDSPTSRTVVYDDHFSFMAGTNIVSIPINLPAGRYILEYGFFLTSEAGSEFQKCYQVSCEFRRL